jgi:hypothetical protein
MRAFLRYEPRGSGDQGGHFFEPNYGDPWLNAPNATIAKSGVGYTMDSSGTGRTNFMFNKCYSYAVSTDKVMVTHGTINDLIGDCARVSCGALSPVIVATEEKWYVDTDR